MRWGVLQMVRGLHKPAAKCMHAQRCRKEATRTQVCTPARVAEAARAWCCWGKRKNESASARALLCCFLPPPDAAHSGLGAQATRAAGPSGPSTKIGARNARRRSAVCAGKLLGDAHTPARASALLSERAFLSPRAQTPSS